MKREKEIRYKHDISTHFPLFFWKECCMCGKEFRREKMWETITGPFQNRIGHIRNLCKECAPTDDRAHEIFVSGEWNEPMARPPAPPPPPPKKYIYRKKR